MADNSPNKDRDEERSVPGFLQNPRTRMLLPLILIGSLFLVGPLFSGSGATGEELTYSQLLERVERGDVATVVINADGRVEGTTVDDEPFTSAVPTAIDDPDLVSVLTEAGVEVEARPEAQTNLFVALLVNLLPLVLIVGVFYWFMRRRAEGMGNPLGQMGSSRAKVTDTERPDTKFSDVAGYDGVKKEVAEVVEYLTDPDKFRRLGAKGPRGILLAGPPGTGKTLMARALAGEAEVPFLSAAGSEFVEMLVGVGASRVRDLFEKARKMAPAIIFIDELDSLGRARGGGNNIGSNQEQEQTLNQMLAEMDGFDRTSGIVVVAATNRPEMLDSALTRPGRFDRTITMGPPSQPDRLEILQLHARGKVLDEDVDLQRLARGTTGFTGAQLENLLNEAALIAVRQGDERITANAVEAARDRIILGRRDESVILTADEQFRVAVHEAGHAIVAALREDADPVSKVTVLGAGMALGVTHQLPHTEQRLRTERELTARLDVALGGRAAELVVLEQASTGASNDLMQATRVATSMVRDLGLSERIGPVGYSDPSEGGVPPALRSRPYAEETQRDVDREVARLLGEAEDRAINDLRSHRAQVDELVRMLLTEEVVQGERVYEILGREAPEPPRMADDMDWLSHLDDGSSATAAADDAEPDHAEPADVEHAPRDADGADGADVDAVPAPTGDDEDAEAA